MSPSFFNVRQISCPIKAYDWPFARRYAKEIAEHWRKQCAVKSSLFDGRVFLCRNIGLRGDQWRAEYFETSFSAFLAWRDFDFPDKDVFNGFAMAALRSYDGAWLLGRMGDDTANSGLCYFPAGTPDRNDIRDGEIDLNGSLIRELLEETGLHYKSAIVERYWTVLIFGSRVAYFRKLQFNQTAEALCARVESYIRSQHKPELDRLIAIRRLENLDAHNIPEFMRAYLSKTIANE